jgi:uncharacterized protein YigA (DUF484 family)
MNPEIKPDDIAHYLQDHPEFFEQYADLLSLVTLADPHSGRAISITEKQLVNLRDKVRTLEAKLVELIGFGEENDAISDKVHGLAVALIAARPRRGGARAVLPPRRRLRRAACHAAPVGRRQGGGHEFDPVADAVKAFAAGLQQALLRRWPGRKRWPGSARRQRTCAR